MSYEKNIQTVKDFFAAIGRGDRERLLALAICSPRVGIDGGSAVDFPSRAAHSSNTQQ